MDERAPLAAVPPSVGGADVIRVVSSSGSQPVSDRSDREALERTVAAREEDAPVRALAAAREARAGGGAS
jgi:hypothetical protein